MKKFVPILIAAALAIAMVGAGCGEDSSSTAATTSATTATKSTKTTTATTKAASSSSAAQSSEAQSSAAQSSAAQSSAAQSSAAQSSAAQSSAAQSSAAQSSEAQSSEASYEDEDYYEDDYSDEISVGEALDIVATRYNVINANVGAIYYDGEVEQEGVPYYAFNCSQLYDSDESEITHYFVSTDGEIVFAGFIADNGAIITVR